MKKPDPWGDAARALRTEHRAELADQAPDPETLARFFAGALSEAEAEEVRVFLAAFPEVADASCADHTAAALPALLPASASSGPRVNSGWLLAASAAAVLLAAGWLGQTFATAPRVVLPQALELDLRRRPAPTPVPIVLEPGADELWLELRLPVQAFGARGALELRRGEGAQGQVLWRQEALELGPAQTLGVVVPRRWVSAGLYQLRLLIEPAHGAPSEVVYWFVAQ